MSETENPLNAHKKTAKQQLLYAIYMSLRRLTQSFLVVVIFVIIGVAVLWLRLQAGPIDMDFARDRIQNAIDQQVQPYNVELGEISLIWRNIKDPFLIAAKNIRVYEDNAVITAVQDVQIGLSPTSLLKAKVRPSFLKISNPEIKFLYKDDKVTFCCEATTVDEIKPRLENEADNIKIRDSNKKYNGIHIKEIRKQARIFFDDILNDSLTGPYSFFQALDTIELQDIALIILETGETDKSLGKFDLRLEKSGGDLVGDLKGLFFEGNDTAQVNTKIIYRGDFKDLTFMGKVNNLKSKALDKFFVQNEEFKRQNITMSGDVQAAFNEDFKLSMARLNISIPEGVFSFNGSVSQNITAKDVVLKSYFNRAKNILNIESLEGEIADIPISLSSLGTIERGKIFLPVALDVPVVKMEDINNIIPDLKNKSGGLSWPKYRLADGVLSDISASLNLNIIRNKGTKKRSISADNIKADFKFNDMTIRYSDTLLPATNADGEGSYENDNLVVESTSAKIKEIKASLVTVDIKDLTKSGAGQAAIKIEAQGGVKSILQYLSSKPINLGKNLGFNVDTVKGDAKAKVSINFPTTRNIKKDDFTVNVDGVLNNLVIPNIVENLPLSSGPYTLKYADSQLSLQGSGLFASRPITLDYKQNMKVGTSKITAKIIADEGLRKSFGVSLGDYIKGAIPLDVSYENNGENSVLDVRGDLLQTDINIEPIAFKKLSSVPGVFSFKGLLKNGEIKEIDALKVSTKGLNLEGGRLIFNKDGKGRINVSRGSLKDIKLKDNNVSADFEVTNDNSLKMLIKASYLDANPFLTTEINSQKYSGPQKVQPRKISLSVEKLKLKNDVISKNTKIYYERSAANKTNNFEMDAKIGSGNTIIRLKPGASNGNKRVFIESTDAGAFLKGAGIYKNIKGGTLNIQGSPIKLKNTDIVGKARIDNFRVKDAPVVAKLINTLSLPGILGLLSNEGLTFDRMESDFEWRFKPKGDLLIVKDGRSSGASLGLTFEGVINRETNITDISGTVIPMSEVNKIIGNIPVIGNILTGGGALLAATYKVKGPTSDPKVSVNPLAALAPGVLRKIIFEEGIDKKIKAAE